MAGRRANANRIRGPQSALTDFLAANNISAAQIRDDYERRVRDAADEEQTSADVTTESVDVSIEPEQPSSSKKRKRFDLRTIALEKVKAKKYQKHKKRKADSDSEDNVSDEFFPEIYQKARPLPGQLENCEVCNKRFTVTPYSKTGGDGGLLCHPCGKEFAAEAKKEPKPKKPAQGKRRRKLESDRLDGLVTMGPKTLQQLCIEKVADHHLDLEEFGDLPENVLERLSEIFSKRRVMNPRTLGLFLRPDLDRIAIHEAADLKEDDFKQIFAVVPGVETLVLRNASQFKDSVLMYMLEKATCIKHLQLYGANLITNSAWQMLFETYGHNFETLKLQWLDASFNDMTLATMIQYCPNIRRLKLKYCRQITPAAIVLLAAMKHLEHLSLQFSHQIEPEDLNPLIIALGPQLQTLSLEDCNLADDSVLNTIHKHCSKLRKVRVTENYNITDAAYTSLFSSVDEAKASVLWKNPGLRFIDFSGARDMDNTNPLGPTDAPVGIATNALQAMMAHSGSEIERLHLASCRHIPHAAFCDVFNGSQMYPALKEINISFCNAVDSAVVSGIFKCCPKLKKLVAFGCFNIGVVTVPAGIALIGVPKAHDAIEQFGDAPLGADNILSSLIEIGA